MENLRKGSSSWKIETNFDQEWSNLDRSDRIWSKTNYHLYHQVQVDWLKRLKIMENWKTGVRELKRMIFLIPSGSTLVEVVEKLSWNNAQNRKQISSNLMIWFAVIYYGDIVN